MAKVQPLEDKDFEPRNTDYLRPGVHEVFIKSAKRGQLDNEKKTEYVELGVEGEDGSGTVTMFISEKAAPYTLARLAQVAVHNEASDEAKQKVRDRFKKINDTDKIDQAFLDLFVDMQCWVLTEEDTSGKQKPNGGFYLRNNLYSYEPKPRTVTAANLTTDQMKAGGTPVDTDEIPF